MDGKRLITSLRLRNLLSFGPDSEEIPLEPLNVLIGPNASGKSNVIDAISLLHAAPDDIRQPIWDGGGIREWLWKGTEPDPTAEVTAEVVGQSGVADIRYRVAFTKRGHAFAMTDEAIETHVRGDTAAVLGLRYAFRAGRPKLTERLPDSSSADRELASESFDASRSVLAQLRDPARYPEITFLSVEFGRIRVFGEWRIGRRGATAPPYADVPGDFLSEDASNLALVVNHLQNRTGVEERLNEHLRRFYPRARKVTARIVQGTVDLQLHEQGLREPIPATRLSDGTLRYLCLLTVLLHPEPPPLVCIEEPELGLHPDILPALAELMVDAAQRTQFIITTHSEGLVSALSSIPEAVAICERGEDGGTVIRRLEEEKLREWLQRYSLGDLWAMGELGGNP